MSLGYDIDKFSARNDKTKIPEWIEKGLPSPTGRHTFTTWRLWNKDEPLLPSGLIGPVRQLVVEAF